MELCNAVFSRHIRRNKMWQTSRTYIRMYGSHGRYIFLLSSRFLSTVATFFSFSFATYIQRVHESRSPSVFRRHFQFNFISHTHMWNNTQVELCHSLSRLTCIVMLHAHTFCPQQSPCSHVHLLVVYFVPSHSLVHRLRLWRCCRRGLLLRFLYHWTFVPPHEELLLCSFFLGQLDE